MFRVGECIEKVKRSEPNAVSPACLAYLDVHGVCRAELETHCPVSLVLYSLIIPLPFPLSILI